MYVIGEDKHNTFIKIRTRFAANLKFEIWQVVYDIPQKQATLFETFQEVVTAYNEILNRVKQIDFETNYALLDILNEKKGFDKIDFARNLKIYKLTPQLLDNNGFKKEAILDVADEKNFEEKSAYNYYNLSKLYFSQFLLCYEKCNNINVKENKNLNLALEYIDKAIELNPNIALYYDARSEILDLLGYSDESLKDSFMASTLKDK